MVVKNWIRSERSCTASNLRMPFQFARKPTSPSDCIIGQLTKHRATPSCNGQPLVDTFVQRLQWIGCSNLGLCLYNIQFTLLVYVPTLARKEWGSACDLLVYSSYWLHCLNRWTGKPDTQYEQSEKSNRTNGEVFLKTYKGGSRRPI